ncbi:FAD/NAD(P)-binding domain-containing protein [Annulohypoxylon maeteangense]|uniref:FAD/NAD(P)-binding domain-containing protein n=1 Tax=Annulohypoxylon maeteangense TaxID=1927788 RepID=UPI002008905E|nr:FAD/NAD(P)-binding domain-containing protein [Annulohypoxylon maeteangense]KAI0887888.1 FAD/NAD(P)-binding domain-containing protein [Annulohypoxylon maeteangense]
MSVPDSCTVLVIGGGPAGSYAAAALAREGIDVVMLEADRHPRYHVGESMLPSARHYLKFIDGFDKWQAKGFQIKNGGAFRLDPSLPDSYTDFIASGGPAGYAWNVIRSESDELLFKHAGSCGAKTFDKTKVDTIHFESPTPIDKSDPTSNTDASGLGRPVSATWCHKDGRTGTISFRYLVDASGRQGILSTKYLKNRKFNQGLKNVASWGYWTGGGVYGVGTYKEGSPFFESLTDSSGWCWFIPLNNGTHSVGIVQNQQMATDKKRSTKNPSTKDFYLSSLDLVPGTKELLCEGELISEVRSASDWSYSASTYALPYARIVGDAGSFIDPFFSSGVHLAFLGGLSAAVTIAASIRGDCDEDTAASWHTKRISESYTRFMLAVLSATKQIRHHNEPVIHDFDEESFDRAFDLFRPIIQGTVDIDATTNAKLTQSEISKTVEFCFRSFADVPQEKKDALMEKLKGYGLDGSVDDDKAAKTIEDIKEALTPEESQILDILRGRRMVRAEDSINLVNFTQDVINGLRPNMIHGNLGLIKATPVAHSSAQLFSPSYLRGGRPDIRTQRGDTVSKARVDGASNGNA